MFSLFSHFHAQVEIAFDRRAEHKRRFFGSTEGGRDWSDDPTICGREWTRVPRFRKEVVCPSILIVVFLPQEPDLVQLVLCLRAVESNHYVPPVNSYEPSGKLSRSLFLCLRVAPNQFGE